MEGIVLILFLLGLYFLPTLCAGARGRRNTGAIFILNLFLGWSLVGWVIALVWAFTADQPAQAVVTQQSWSPDPDPHRNEKKCHACAEWIMRDAIKCKHCGEMQGGATLTASPVAFMGYCPGCGKIRSSTISTCVYCKDSGPVMMEPPKLTPPPPPAAGPWTQASPQPRTEAGIDWNKVDHADRNRGRS